MWSLLIAVFTVTTTNAVNDGQCPEPTAVQNFNGTAWAGLWYMVSTYSDDPEVMGTCPNYQDVLIGDTYKLQKWHIVNGVRYYLEGYGKMQPGANNSAKFNASVKLNNMTVNILTILLGSDYSSYAVVYNCKYNDTTNTHQIFPWVLSRTKVLEDSAKTAVNEVIANTSVIDFSKFVQYDFSEEACNYTRTVNVNT